MLRAWALALAAAAAAPPGVTPRDAANVAPLRDHADDVTDYTLVARLDPIAHTVHGEGTIRFRNTSAVAVRELWLHLYLNAFKNERSAFLREPAAGSRGSGALTDWGTMDLRTLALRGTDGVTTDLLGAVELTRSTGAGAGARSASVAGGSAPQDDDETDARVPLPRDVEPGEVLTLDVTWDDKLPSVLERTGYSGTFHMVGQWFPKLARLEPDGTWAHFPFHHLAEFYADFGTYDVTLDVPEGFVVGATGPIVEARHEGGRAIERHVQGDIHDFAWTAWDRFDVREETLDGVRVRALFPRGFERDASRELAAVRFALPYFSARYGRYPYPVLTLVHPPEAASEAGGMEYPTLITTGGAWHGVPFTRVIELVTVHELGHQWFYGLLASNESQWPFLDEGLNSYAEADVLRAMYGDASAGSFGGLDVSDDAVQAVIGNSAAHDAPVAQPAYEFTTGNLYGALVYDRTAAILETLRRVYGERAMTAAFGAYTRLYRFEHPGPESLVRAFSDGMGGEAAATLRRALFDEGWVDYAVTEVVSHPTAEPRGIFDRGGKRETVQTAPAAPGGGFDGWVLVERRGTLSFPVEVELALANGSRQRLTWDGRGSSTRLPYRGASALEAAVVDPDHTVLLDDDLTNNHRSARDAPAKGATRVLELATYLAELLIEGLSP